MFRVAPRFARCTSSAAKFALIPPASPRWTMGLPSNTAVWCASIVSPSVTSLGGTSSPVRTAGSWNMPSYQWKSIETCRISALKERWASIKPLKRRVCGKFAVFGTQNTSSCYVNCERFNYSSTGPFLTSYQTPTPVWSDRCKINSWKRSQENPAT